MDNIFENAYFGKPYKTRDERRAVYIHHYKDSESDDMYYLIIEGSVVTYVWGADGKIAPSYKNDGLDIVSEWTISEEELERLALEKYPIRSEIVRNGLTFVKVDPNEPKREYFKVGYRKAKES